MCFVHEYACLTAGQITYHFIYKKERVKRSDLLRLISFVLSGSSYEAKKACKIPAHSGPGTHFPSLTRLTLLPIAPLHSQECRHL